MRMDHFGRSQGARRTRLGSVPAGKDSLDIEGLFHRHGLLAASKQESTAETAATVLLIVQPVQMIVAVALRVIPALLAFTTQDTAVPTALTALQSPVRSSARE